MAFICVAAQMHAVKGVHACCILEGAASKLYLTEVLLVVFWVLDFSISVGNGVVQTVLVCVCVLKLLLAWPSTLNGGCCSRNIEITRFDGV